MQVFGGDVLEQAMRRHRDVRNWLLAWMEKVELANWESLDDLRSDYPATDGVKLRSLVVVTVFNVRGNQYRLLTQVSYEEQAVLVLELLTHAEYDKNRWKERY